MLAVRYNYHSAKASAGYRGISTICDNDDDWLVSSRPPTFRHGIDWFLKRSTYEESRKNQRRVCASTSTYAHADSPFPKLPSKQVLEQITPFTNLSLPSVWNYLFIWRWMHINIFLWRNFVVPRTRILNGKNISLF